MKRYVLRALSVALAFLLALGCVFAGCTKEPAAPETPQVPVQPSPDDPETPQEPSVTPPEGQLPEEDAYPDELFTGKLANTSAVGMRAEYLGTVRRSLPEVSDGGLDRYPEYGVTLQAEKEEKQKIISENEMLNASSSSYDSMDAEGNLYLNGQATGKKLYKHTASFGMYEGDVDDNEPALVKRITIRPRTRGNYVTGLYAPAGEVVKIEMSEKSLAATGGIVVVIGQELVNGSSNNIWLERDFNRMPVIVNKMTVSSQTGYVGSYLGGPIYIRPVRTGAQFTVTISGAVGYSHYIHGYTTREEFDYNKDSSAPYFDLEVWDDGVRHSGPKSRAARFDYDDLSSAAVLWDKIALVSNRVPSGSPGDTGIVFLYDPFVAAGSMVAFVGRYTVNCPLYCMEAALDASSAVDDPSDAFWGCIHEFNHHFQRFGFAPGDEVTNNAVSLVEYSLFTRVSAKRSLGSASEGTYAVGWNRYTNPSWSLRQTLANTGANSGLDSYANLLHAFGQDAFIRACAAGEGAGGADAWYKAVCNATGYDMTYYFEDVLHQTVSQSVLEEQAKKDAPMFVPVACIYQTGRGYTRNDRLYFSRTAQPYVIEKGKEFVLDLNETIVLPSGFTYRIESVTQPVYGALSQREEGVYAYTPSAAHKGSGTIYVTLSLQKADGSFEAENVTLVIELYQGQYRPNVLERTVYTYSADKMYETAAEAYESGYEGYESVREEDNENHVQNGNTEIWEPDPGTNAVMEVRGKFLIESTGKYRVALRGRRSAALYISEDGENYRKAAALYNDTNGSGFDLSEEGRYSDFDFSKGQWIYFKAVLLVDYERAFIGVGMGRFNGENVSVGYLNAYRSSYMPEPFETEYFYTRSYAYDGESYGVSQTLTGAKYSPWDSSYPIENLFDEDRSNYIHSDRTSISEDNPFEVEAELGAKVWANRFTIYGTAYRPYQPKTFRLYGGTSEQDMWLLADVRNAERTGENVIVDFEPCEISRYKLVVTDTFAGAPKYIAYRYAEFSYALPGGSLLSPDEDMFVFRGNWLVKGALAPFGHIYEGQNASVEFTFTGTRFALLCLPGEAGKFEVLIDGKAAENFASAAAGSSIAYLSDVLEAGTHTVVVRSKERFGLTAVALWEQ